MRRPQTTSLVAPLLAALVLGACGDTAPTGLDAPDAPALARAAGVDQNFSFPLDLVVPAKPQCGIDTEIRLVGTFSVTTRATQSASGQQHVGVTWRAHGTATGADGTHYVFNYVLVSRALGPVDLAAPSGEFVLVDHFNLIGRGGAPDMRIAFRGVFAVTQTSLDPAGFVAFTGLDYTIRGGELECDPI